MKKIVFVVAVIVLFSGFGYLSGQPVLLESQVSDTVRGRCQLESASVLEIRCDVASPTRILSIAPEGSVVKEGDLLVELDAALLAGRLEEQKIAIESDKAAFVQTEARIEQLQQDTDRVIEAAKLGENVSALARTRLFGEGGEFDMQENAVENELSVAREGLKIAQQRLQYLQVLSDQRAASTEELAEAKLAVVEVEAEVNATVAKQRFLKEHAKPYEKAVLEFEANQRTMDLARQVSENKRDRGVLQAELRAQQAKLQITELRFQRIVEQIEKCKVYAPRDGLVLYAAATASRRGSYSVPLKRGATVRNRQVLIRMPDMNRLQMKVQIHETSVSRVRPGQTATIRIDAFPNETLSGRVLAVSTAPERARRTDADVKEYAATVSIDDPPAELKPGMTGLVDIEVSQARPQP